MAEAVAADIAVPAEQADRTETLDTALRLASIPFSGIVGFAVAKSAESYNPATDAVSQETSVTIPTATGQIGGQPRHHSEMSTAHEIGFAVVPMLFTTAAVAIATGLRRHRNRQD